MQNTTNNELGLLMPLMGRITCYVRNQTSQIYKSQGYDLTPEAAHTLLIIHHFDGMPQKTLADILGKDKASITRLLNTLVKSKLVERTQDEEDRRIIRAHITQEGKDAFAKLHPELNLLSNQVFSTTPKQDFETMLRILSNIVSNLSCASEKEN